MTFRAHLKGTNRGEAAKAAAPSFDKAAAAAACADSPPTLGAKTATDHVDNAGRSDPHPNLLGNHIPRPLNSPLNSQERLISLPPGAYHVRGADFRGDTDEPHENNAGDGGQAVGSRDDIPATTSARSPDDAHIEVEAYTVPGGDEMEETIDRLHQQLGSARQELVSARQELDVARSQLSAPAEVVDGVLLSTEDEENGGKKRIVAIVVFLLLLFTIAVGVAVSVYLTQQNGQDDSVNPPQAKEVLPPVLETLKERGVLRCGVGPDPGQTDNVTGLRVGFEIDLCKAVAAASLGSSYRFEPIAVPPENRFLALGSGEIDLIVSPTSHTFERDVHEASAGVGFSFSAPYIYSGLAFTGIPEFVACADELNAVGECANLMICVLEGTTWVDFVKGLFPGTNIVIVDQPGDILGLINDVCNVFGLMSERTARQFGYKGAFAMGKNTFSKDPLAIVTRDGDPEFAHFVNWVLQGLLQAEEHNITLQTADTFPKTSLFGDEYENMFQNALAAVGNYGEMYSRHLDNLMIRRRVNMLNKGDTGLLYSHPLGKIDTIGPGPIKGGVIERIIKRGFLRCGITPEDSKVEMISGTRVGLDIEFCRALSAIIFEGRTENIIFESFPERYGYTNASLALEKGDIDVYAGGAMHNMNGTVRHPGLSISKPYFFESKENSTGFRAHLLVTKEDDAQWTALLYWVIMASFHAEENDIVQKMSNKMPLINLFGPNLQRILRDAILAIGNYGEMYERVFGQNASRVGRNLLNGPPFSPQHSPLLFGNYPMD